MRIGQIGISGSKPGAGADPGTPPPAPPRKRSHSLAFIWNEGEMYHMYRNILDRLDQPAITLLLEDSDPDLMPGMLTAAARTRCQVMRVSEALSRGIVFDYLVSHHYMRDEAGEFLRQLGRRQIRYVYGLGVDKWHFAAWNRIYDMILCFGPYQQARLAPLGSARIVQVGYPRYDDFFIKRPDRGAIVRRLGLDPARPTVVWLPTWSTLSSIPHYHSAIAALAADYNVVVKPHPLTLVKEPDKMDLLTRYPGLRVRTDDLDILEMYVLADWVVSDYGGTAFSAIYTDRNLLLLDVPGAEANPQLANGSSDLVIRKDVARLTPDSAGELAALLKAPGLWKKQAEVRSGLRTTFFAPYFGYSSNLAASVLANPEIVLG